MVYKVVVVDDEPLLLRSIIKSITNAHPGFQIVGEAMDGDSAIAIIEQTLPDVVFTDIRMPVVDGLALIETLRIRHIETKVVILSGYQEFEYAKKALKFGVEEYLLKPIDQGELKKLLTAIYEDLEDIRSSSQQHVLELLLNSDINMQLPHAQMNKSFGGYKAFGAILICSGSYCTFSCSWFTPGKDFWLRLSLNDILLPIIKERYKHWILDLGHGNDKLIILAARDEAEPAFSQIFELLYNTLQESHFPITAVAGRPMTTLADLPYIIQTSKISLYKSVLYGFSKMVYAYHAAESNGKIESLMDGNTEKLLKLFIENQQYEPFKLTVKKILDAYQAQRAPQLRLESLLKHIVNMLHASHKYIPENRPLEIDMEIDELISNSITYQAIYEGISFICSEMFNRNQRQAPEKNDQLALIERVESYIVQNYSKALSLQSIAEDFGLVLPYLSSLFKKHKGVSPMEFIISLRIDKAKELLLIKPVIALKDIAESIGYEDPYYFSRIFKSVTGKSPSESRENQG